MKVKMKIKERNLIKKKLADYIYFFFLVKIKLQKV